MVSGLSTDQWREVQVESKSCSSGFWWVFESTEFSHELWTLQYFLLGVSNYWKRKYSFCVIMYMICKEKIFTIKMQNFLNIQYTMQYCICVYSFSFSFFKYVMSSNQTRQIYHLTTAFVVKWNHLPSPFFISVHIKSMHHYAPAAALGVFDFPYFQVKS